MASAPPYDPSIDYAALGYGPDMPGQNSVGAPTNLLSQIQPQAADPNAAPVDPNAQAQPQTNILQQAVQQQQTNTPPQLGQPIPANIQSAPNQQFQDGRLLPQNPPRQRLSLIDTLGRIGDAVSRMGGQGGVYQSTIEHNLAQQELGRTNSIMDATKLQDLAQTGVAAQQNANQLVNAFANGLKSIRDAGGNLAASAPALAQQLGIPPQQAQAILAQEQQTPGFVDNLADATETAGGKAGRQRALALIAATDNATGKNVFLQPTQDGVEPVQGYSPLGSTSTVNAGDKEVILDKRTGKSIGEIQKAGTPDPGSVPTGVRDANGNMQYAPLSSSATAAKIAETKAQTDKITAENQATAEKARTAAAADQQKQRAVQDNLKSLEAGIYKLRDLGALNSTAANPVGNMANAFQATGVGQAISHVANPNVAAARDQIKAAANGILLNMSAGRSQMFRTNAEQTRALQAINNPQSSLPVMLQALKAFKDAATPTAPAAAPAGKAPAPKGAWGKAQVVQ